MALGYSIKYPHISIFYLLKGDYTSLSYKTKEHEMETGVSGVSGFPI